MIDALNPSSDRTRVAVLYKSPFLLEMRACHISISVRGGTAINNERTITERKGSREITKN